MIQQTEQVRETLVSAQFAVPVEGLTDELVKQWVNAARTSAEGEVCVRFIGKDEGRSLNKRFRDADIATNVLAFPMQDAGILGDIAVCVPLAKLEAQQQEKSLLSHLAHLVVHGTLHLRGFDHDTPSDAEAMEKLETSVMRSIGFEDPY